MKKEWTYKQKGLRNAMISINSLILNDNLIFAIKYDKKGFYESQLISLNLNTRKENVILQIPHVMRNIPVRSNGNLYVNAFDGNMYCIDEQSLAIKWITKFGNGNPDWHICVDDDHIFSFNGELFCLNKITGDIIWQYKHASNHASCNIIVKGNHLFHGLSEGYLYCFDIEEQKIIWTFGEKLYFRSCMLIEKILVACASNGIIYLVNADSGEQIFMFDTGGAIYQEPVFIDDKLFVGNDIGAVYCLDGLSQYTLNECWRYKADNKIASNPMVHDNCVWISSEDNFIHKLDFLTGKQIMKKKTPSYPRSFTMKDNKLITLSDKGQVDCYSF